MAPIFFLITCCCSKNSCAMCITSTHSSQPANTDSVSANQRSLNSYNMSDSMPRAGYAMRLLIAVFHVLSCFLSISMPLMSHAKQDARVVSIVSIEIVLFSCSQFHNLDEATAAQASYCWMNIVISESMSILLNYWRRSWSASMAFLL